MTQTNSTVTYPPLGFGLGLRVDHYEEILNSEPDIDWLEVLSENYMIPGGRPLRYLERMRARYPLVMHGVSLSIGSSAPLNSQSPCRRRGSPITCAGPVCTTRICTT